VNEEDAERDRATQVQEEEEEEEEEEGLWGHARYRRASAHEDTSTLATVGA